MHNSMGHVCTKHVFKVCGRVLLNIIKGLYIVITFTMDITKVIRCLAILFKLEV